MIILENRKIAVIGVDHGYGNIKTAGTVTPTGITAYDSEPVFSGNILEYNGRYYRIGEGHKEFIADKAEDEDFYLLTLMAIAREMNLKSMTKADVHLAAGLPLTWVRAQRERFKAYLLRNQTIKYRFNAREYEVRFAGCSVYPQGYPAIISRTEEMKGVSLLVDIGNGTMNILYIIGKKPIEAKSWTEKYGANQCMIAAKNALMDELGANVEEAIIEPVLRNGTAEIGQKYLDIILKTAKQYTDGIFSVLRKYEYNPELMHLFVVGGGGCLIRNFAEYDEKRVTIINDICASAKGYEFLASKALQRNEKL
ncbi:MAG: ParM/StbA family protein [Clostridiales bacterium]|nr:ParM/StbA family protein [Clostridiales bacterium]